MNELNGHLRTGISIENREKITVSGIIRVDSFDEKEVSARCENCGVVVFGQNLHISRLDLESGTLTVDGFICGVEYSDTDKKSGFLSKLFQ